MKKRIFMTLLIVLTVLISTFSPSFSFAQLSGDLNSDGSVDSIDFAYFKRYLLNINLLYDSTPADLNGDGIVDSTDFAYLKRYLLNIIKVFPVDSQTTPTTNPTPTQRPLPTPTNTPVLSDKPVLDTMNYVSDSKSIHIKKYENGTGQNKITYFVADVKISKGSDIQSAFAKGKFGLNITDTTSNMAEQNDAIFAVNGSYYGFRQDGIEIRNGVLYRDVPIRTGLAIYNNGAMESYTESSGLAKQLLENDIYQGISFGPALIKSGVLKTDFTNTIIDINSSSMSAKMPIEGANPRTGIGMVEPNHFVFIVVDGREPGYSKGATLAEFAKMFYDLGCKEAYNLDGGGSSTMYFNGKIINKPSLDRERTISDILYITKWL